MRSIIAFLLLCVPLLADERPGRVLFFHASWCKPCVEALEGPQEFPDWLRKAGWKIGVGPENHIQLVDIDRRDDLKTIYNIESIPSMVVIGGDLKVHEYKGRQSIVDLLPKNTSAVSHAGQHSHLCRSCGTEWWHGAENFGSTSAHKCPNCGRVEWTVNRQGTLGPVGPKVSLPSLPVFRTRGNCPTGNCPLR